MKSKNRWLWVAGGLAIAALTVGYAYVAVFITGCPIRELTGIPCPGCGMSRAWLSLLRGDFAAAWRYHPLFWLVPVALALLFVKKGPLATVKGRAVLWSLIALTFVLVYLLRLWNGDSF